MFTDSSILERMRRVPVEDLLLPLLIQFVLIVAAARLFGWLFRRFLGQPSVVGEITAGLVLGPSVLGQVSPELFHLVFRPVVGDLPPEASDLLLSNALTALAQIGLVLMLFLVGLDFDFGHLRWQGWSALIISLVGLVVPFALGVGLGMATHELVAADIPWHGYVLFMGTSLAITAMPVLGSMMFEWGITRTSLGAVAIAAAAIEDAIGWILLAAVAAGARAAFSPGDTARMFVSTVAFVAFMVVVARPLLSHSVRAMLRAGNGEPGMGGLAAVFVLIFLCGAVTNSIGVCAVFGAFLLGAVLSGEHEFREVVNRRMREVVTSFLLPIFFAYTGLRTNIGTLESWQLWGLAAVLSLAAVAGKLGGCGLAAWLCGMKPREAACVGAMMNTRGLMELVVINVGKDLGVIPDSAFCMLVLMALGTTFMTTPLLMRFMRGTELEPCIVASGFLEPEPVYPHTTLTDG